MSNTASHTFHIPVMGLAFTIDTPVKVARFGISSVLSIIEDHLIEQMREFYCRQEQEEYEQITIKEEDYRARRITAYLNQLDRIVKKQLHKMKTASFDTEGELVKYFELLPDDSPVKKRYDEMTNAKGSAREDLQNQLRDQMVAGSIDVNIMTKLDKTNYDEHGEKLPPESSDAMAALRGYAKSNLSSSIIFSAGMSPRLYSYCESFPDFFPDAEEQLKKKIILKVSDYRSAIIQGKFLAKKGLWVSEFRIESGLNCGGHAFATEGLLLGPILEEFKVRRAELAEELYLMCNAALAAKGEKGFTQMPEMKITVQGGIGTAHENTFLLQNYHVDSTGWGSPFLLVPDVTNVDDETLQQLATAKKEDYYLSDSSPLGIPFNNFKPSSSENQRHRRIEKQRPGSPCYLKFLSSNTEFTEKPICTASREYQDLKIKQLKEQQLPIEIYEAEVQKIVVKDCLCTGLGTAALIKNNIPPPHRLKAVAICPGPNLAYFSGTFSLQQMVNHIYGRGNILNTLPRPHLFINELNLYVDYLKKEVDKSLSALTDRRKNYLHSFKENLLKGIAYYKLLIPAMQSEAKNFLEQFQAELTEAELAINRIAFPE